MTPPEFSPSAAQHRGSSPAAVRCAVLTVSDSRRPDNDTGGQTIVELLEAAGHSVAERTIVPDEPAQVVALVRRWAAAENVDAIIITGGTGAAPRDQTPEAIADLLTKPLPGYGELLRMLSYQEIGPAAMLSRALGGLVDQTVVLTMPGSPNAVRLAMERIILPELGHLVGLATP